MRIYRMVRNEDRTLFTLILIMNETWKHIQTYWGVLAALNIYSKDFLKVNKTRTTGQTLDPVFWVSRLKLHIWTCMFESEDLQFEVIFISLLFQIISADN